MKKIILSSILICISFFSVSGTQLDSGEYYSLALKEDGTAWAWGNGGQLGDGTGDNRLTPVQVIGISDVISISAGYSHSLALKRDGAAWAWGYNYHGQLGNGTTDPPFTVNLTPGQVIGLSGVIDIAGGAAHSLFLKSDGTVWACGMNRNGQLGDGTTTDKNIPVQVSGLSGIIAIAGGGEHSLALKSDGTVWAWGENGAGQLGDGNSGEGLYSTIPVQTFGLSNVTAIVAGEVHSLALRRDGTVWAWGYNSVGQLGDGNSGTDDDGSYI